MFRVAVRADAPPTWRSAIIFAAALALALLLSALLLYVQGKPGFTGVGLLLEGGFGHLYSWEDTVRKAIPIFLCSLGVAFCFRLQIWNIGAEGQYVLGAIGGTAFIMAFPGLPAPLMLPGMFCASALAGALWAGLVAFCRLRWKMNEIITSLMLNYIAVYLLDFLVFGPFKDPGKSNHPVGIDFPPAAIVPNLFGNIHWGFVFCLLLAFSTAFFMKKTRPGFEFTAAGSNEKAARYAGIPHAFLVALSLVICGAMAGMAGIMECSVTVGHLEASISAGYGFTAVVVAWLARLKTSRIVFFSIILAGIRVGVENLQIDLQVSKNFAQVMDGLILLAVLAGQFFDNYRLKRLQKA